MKNNWLIVYFFEIISVNSMLLLVFFVGFFFVKMQYLTQFDI